MRRKIYGMCGVALLLSACSGTPSARVEPIRPEDRQLSCADLEIEMYEADYLRRKAIENKGLSFGNMIAPWRYPSTISNANKAIEASDERIEYLQRMHEIRGCGTPETREARMRPQPPVNQPMMASQGYVPYPQQPVYGYGAPSRPPVLNYGLDYQPKAGYPAGSSYQPVTYGGYNY